MVATALTGACSHLPPAQLPAHADYDVVAHCEVAADGRLPIPTSTRDTVVWSLRTDPLPSAELLAADGGRWFRYAPGTKVAIACRVRRYGTDLGANPLAELFPVGARITDAGPDSVPR